MVMIEFKEAAKDRAFGLLDATKESVKNSKLALCELEDVLCDIFEGETGDYESEEDSMIGLRRSRSGMRSSMRSYGYRRGMRMRDDYYNRYAY